MSLTYVVSSQISSFFVLFSINPSGFSCFSKRLPAASKLHTSERKQLSCSYVKSSSSKDQAHRLCQMISVQCSTLDLTAFRLKQKSCCWISHTTHVHFLQPGDIHWCTKTSIRAHDLQISKWGCNICRLIIYSNNLSPSQRSCIYIHIYISNHIDYKMQVFESQTSVKSEDNHIKEDT